MTRVEWRVREGSVDPIPRAAWRQTPMFREEMERLVEEAVQNRGDTPEDYAREQALYRLEPETLIQHPREGTVLGFVAPRWGGGNQGVNIAADDGDILVILTDRLKVTVAETPSDTLHPWAGKRVEWRECRTGYPSWSGWGAIPLSAWVACGEEPSDVELWESAKEYVASAIEATLARQGRGLPQAKKRVLVGQAFDEMKRRWQRKRFGTVFHQTATGEMLVTDEEGTVHTREVSELKLVELD